MADRVDALIEQLTSSSWRTRRSACIQLGELGDVRAFEPLLQRLGDENSDVRAAACRALGALGDVRAFEPLLQRLGDEDSDIRAAASNALGKLGFGAEAQLLSEALGAKTEAVEQLRARIAGGEERLWRPLLAALADSEAVRAAVSRLLGALGDVRAFEPLLQRLGDENDSVRAAASKALGKLGFGS